MTSVQQRVLVVIALGVAAIAGALLAEALLSLDAATPFGHTRYGHAVGWIGLAVTLLVCVSAAQANQPGPPVAKGLSMSAH